jgi:YVTN family beta-propeller protein
MEKSKSNRYKAITWIIFLLILLTVFLTPSENHSSAAILSSKIGVSNDYPKEKTEKLIQADSVPVSLIPQRIDLVAVRGDEPYDIAISPDGSRAYVPARNTDNLFVIDLSNNQIVAVIDLYPQANHPLGPAPEKVALTPDGKYLLITNSNDESVTILNTQTLTVRKTLRFNGHPEHLAVSPNGSFAYVSINEPGFIIKVIDVNHAVLSTSIAEVGYATMPAAVGFAPTGNRAYLAMGSGSVLVINTSNHTVIDTIDGLSGEAIGTDMVINSTGSKGFVSSLEDDLVLALDLVNRQVLSTFNVENPEGLGLNASGDRLYVGTFGYAGEADYNLEMLNANSGARIVGITFDHPAPYGRLGSDIQGLAITPDGETLYAPSIDADGIFVLDPSTLEPYGMIPTQAFARFMPLRAVLSSDGGTLYVGGGIEKPTTISVIDTSTLDVDEMRDNRTGVCSASSYGLALSTANDKLYALSSDCNQLLIFDTSTKSLRNVVNVGTPGASLSHVAVHPGRNRIYVLDLTGNLYVINSSSLAVIKSVSTNVESAWTIKFNSIGTRAYMTGEYGYAVINTSDASNPVVIKQENSLTYTFIV